MKKLSYEDGNIIIREMDGTLFWSSHRVDMKGSYDGEYSEGGYKTILLEGILTEQNDYAGDIKVDL